MMSIENQLHKEIQRDFEKLEEMEVGTDEHKVAVDEMTKLLDRAIEMEKLGAEREDRLVSNKLDEEYKRKQFEDERLDRWVRNGIAVAGIVIPTLVTIWGTKKSFEFEKDGTITTIMGRGFINKLLPKK